jgi:hypothetical protein
MRARRSTAQHVNKNNKQVTAWHSHLFTARQGCRAQVPRAPQEDAFSCKQDRHSTQQPHQHALPETRQESALPLPLLLSPLNAVPRNHCLSGIGRGNPQTAQCRKRFRASR